MRKHFGYPRGREYKPGDGAIDPLFIAACHVVWPRHPIDVDIPGGQTVRIDDRLHLDRLARIDRDAVVARAVDWDCPASFIGEPEWGVWEWHDAQATGSRIRLWFPRNHTSPNCPDLPVNPPEERGLCRQHELASFVEPQLEESGRTQIESGRTQILVRSMFVPGGELALERIGIAPSVGTRVWIDLRGDAAPRLTADRRTMLATEEGGEWCAAIDGTFERAGQALDHGMARAALGVRDNVAYGYLRSNEQAHSIGRGFVTTDFKHKTNKSFDKTIDSINNLNLTVFMFFESVLRDQFPISLARDPGLLRNLGFDLFHDIPNDYERDLRCARMLSRSVVYNDVLANNPELILALDPEFPKDHARSLTRRRAPAADLDRDFDPGSIPPVLVSMLVEHVYSSLLQEGFRPDLSSSWPLFGCRSLMGQIGAATLTGPGIIVFDVEEDGCTVHFSDPSGSEPASLVARGYDLTFPVPAIPLGNLRRNFTAWRTDRRYQPLGVAPFLFPELQGIWRKHAEYLRETFQVPRIFALLPRLDLWSKPFADWTDEDWSTCGISALWNIETGVVLWAHGAHHVDDMPTTGRLAPEFFAKPSTS